MQPVETNRSSARYRKLILPIAAIVALAVVTGGYFHHTRTANTQAIAQQRAEVAARGAKVMPFDLTRTQHVFTPLANGGIQTVTANNSSDTAQIQLIRTHLQEQAEKFSAGDFSAPATIHGEQMPGLAELRSGAKRIDIQYEPLSNGARLRYSTTDSTLVSALHKWFEAQSSDHHNHGSM